MTKARGGKASEKGNKYIYMIFFFFYLLVWRDLLDELKLTYLLNSLIHGFGNFYYFI